MAKKYVLSDEEKRVIAEEQEQYFKTNAGIDLFILMRFKFEPRKNLHSTWIIVKDTYSDNRILLESGSKRHLCFSNVGDAIIYLRKLYINPIGFKKFHLIEECEHGCYEYGKHNDLVRIIPQKEYEEMQDELARLRTEKLEFDALKALHGSVTDEDE